MKFGVLGHYYLRSLHLKMDSLKTYPVKVHARVVKMQKTAQCVYFRSARVILPLGVAPSVVVVPRVELGTFLLIITENSTIMRSLLTK